MDTLRLPTSVEPTRWSLSGWLSRGWPWAAINAEVHQPSVREVLELRKERVRPGVRCGDRRTVHRSEYLYLLNNLKAKLVEATATRVASTSQFVCFKTVEPTFWDESRGMGEAHFLDFLSLFGFVVSWGAFSPCVAGCLTHPCRV